jgi:hypothetical protein
LLIEGEESNAPVPYFCGRKGIRAKDRIIFLGRTGLARGYRELARAVKAKDEGAEDHLRVERSRVPRRQG